MANIIIDGKEYKLEDLSDNTKAQITSIQIVDQKIAQLQTDMAIMQTAYNGYVRDVSNNLPKKEAAKNKKKGVILINDKKYNIEDFKDKYKNIIYSISVTNEKLKDLKNTLAIYRKARNTYSAAIANSVK